MTPIDDLNERIVKCERILSSNPGSQIFAALADAYRKRGDLDLAFQVCQKGLRNHPDYCSAHLVMAKINLDRGMFDWADMEVDRASQLGGSQSATELLRAEILLYKGEHLEALTMLQRIQRNDPTSTQIKELMEVAAKAAKSASSGARRVSDSQGVRPSMVDPIAPFANTSAEPPKRRLLSSYEIIDKICATENVVGGAELNASGQVMAITWKHEKPADEWIAAARDWFEQMSKACDKIALGPLQTVFVESSNTLVYLALINGSRFCFFAGQGANPNRMRGQITQALSSFDPQSKVKGVA